MWLCAAFIDKIKKRKQWFLFILVVLSFNYLHNKYFYIEIEFQVLSQIIRLSMFNVNDLKTYENII